MEPFHVNEHGNLALLTFSGMQASTDLNANFDYAAFLNDSDIDHVADNGSPFSFQNSATDQAAEFVSKSPPSNASSRTLSRSHDSSSDNVVAGGSKRQRLERRGHTKSRRGCYNCKRRRIKCQETRPACGHCVKTGLNCEYPATPQIIHQPQHQIPLFSLQDMRFFQHFLQICYPSHPVGNESVWTHEVPCLAQKHEFLMHAILGLAASELMAEDPSLITFAMTHRLKAIKAIKKSLMEVPKHSNPNSTFEEGNALMATCFALTFQSVCLDDGMAEFMTFCRGIVLVAIQIACKGSKFIFHDFFHEAQMKILGPKMERIPLIDSKLTDAAMESLRGCEVLLARQIDKDYHALLVKMTEALYTDFLLAYDTLSEHYGWWMQISHEDFQQVIDPNDQTMTILAAHWIAIKHLMTPVTALESQGRAERQDKHEGEGEQLGMLRWLRHLLVMVSEENRKFVEWPRWVERMLREDIDFFGKRRL